MFRVRRRSTTRTLQLALAALLAASLAYVPTSAGAGSIAETQKQIADLSAALSRQEARSETTSNEYDADKANLASINADIVTLQGKETQKRAAIVVTQRKLVTAVVLAYVLGAAESQIISIFNQNVTKSDARNVYQDQVIGDLNKLEATYQHEKYVAAEHRRDASPRNAREPRTPPTR